MDEQKNHESSVESNELEKKQEEREKTPEEIIAETIEKAEREISGAVKRADSLFTRIAEANLTGEERARLAETLEGTKEALKILQEGFYQEINSVALSEEVEEVKGEASLSALIERFKQILALYTWNIDRIENNLGHTSAATIELPNSSGQEQKGEEEAEFKLTDEDFQELNEAEAKEEIEKLVGPVVADLKSKGLSSEIDTTIAVMDALPFRTDDTDYNDRVIQPAREKAIAEILTQEEDERVDQLGVEEVKGFSEKEERMIDKLAYITQRKVMAMNLRSPEEVRAAVKESLDIFRRNEDRPHILILIDEAEERANAALRKDTPPHEEAPEQAPPVPEAPDPIAVLKVESARLEGNIQEKDEELIKYRDEVLPVIRDLIHNLSISIKEKNKDRDQQAQINWNLENLRRLSSLLTEQGNEETGIQGWKEKIMENKEEIEAYLKELMADINTIYSPEEEEGARLKTNLVDGDKKPGILKRFFKKEKEVPGLHNALAKAISGSTKEIESIFTNNIIPTLAEIEKLKQEKAETDEKISDSEAVPLEDEYDEAKEKRKVGIVEDLAKYGKEAYENREDKTISLEDFVNSEIGNWYLDDQKEGLGEKDYTEIKEKVIKKIQKAYDREEEIARLKKIESLSIEDQIRILGEGEEAMAKKLALMEKIYNEHAEKLFTRGKVEVERNIKHAGFFEKRNLRSLSSSGESIKTQLEFSHNVITRKIDALEQGKGQQFKEEDRKIREFDDIYNKRREELKARTNAESKATIKSSLPEIMERNYRSERSELIAQKNKIKLEILMEVGFAPADEQGEIKKGALIDGSPVKLEMEKRDLLKERVDAYKDLGREVTHQLAGQRETVAIAQRFYDGTDPKNKVVLNEAKDWLDNAKKQLDELEKMENKVKSLTSDCEVYYYLTDSNVIRLEHLCMDQEEINEYFEARSRERKAADAERLRARVQELEREREEQEEDEDADQEEDTAEDEDSDTEEAEMERAEKDAKNFTEQGMKEAEAKKKKKEKAASNKKEGAEEQKKNEKKEKFSLSGKDWAKEFVAHLNKSEKESKLTEKEIIEDLEKMKIEGGTEGFNTDTAYTKKDMEARLNIWLLDHSTIESYRRVKTESKTAQDEKRKRVKKKVAEIMKAIFKNSNKKD